MPLVVQTNAPDPYEPIIGSTLGIDRFQNPDQYSAQHRRRAEILAATRRVLASEGHEKFTIRSVSEACSLTAQTIHNSFGCKNDLLRAALNQHTLMIDSVALSQTRNPAVFLTLAIAYCQSAVERPDFMREYMRTAFSPKRPLRDPLFKFGTDLKAQMLRGMAQRNLIRPCIQTTIAAEQIAYVNAFGMLEWAEKDDIHQLYERLVLGNGSILLGILLPEVAGDIEKWLSEPANRRWTPLASA